jgi:hypothetical protein
MKRIFLFFIFAILWAIPASAQTNGTGPPSGSCQKGHLYTDNVTGLVYSCQIISGIGTWQSASPAAPGITGPPTTGLMARYDIPSTDSAAALTDSSGNGRNGTGTDGTAPTIGSAANCGGLICGGAGSSQLPASLNTALSIGLYMTLNPPLGAGFYAPVMGNGNHTNNNFAGILITRGNGQGTQEFNILQTDGNNTLHGSLQQGFYGTGPLIYEMDTNDRLFLGTNEGGYNTAIATRASSAGNQTAGFFQLCGNAANDGPPVATRMTGTIWNAYFYDHVLNAAERSQLVSWFDISNAARGQVPSLLTTATGNQLSIVGDSLSMGFSITTGWPNLMTLNTAYTIDNSAQNSNQMQFNIPAPAYVSDFFFVPSATNNLEMVWEGTNDIAVSSRTPAQVISDTTNFVRSRQALGYKTIVSSMIDRTGQSANKDTLDGLWLNNWQTMGNVRFVDLASDANLGADGANANAVFFLSGIHVTQAGEDNDVTPMQQYAANAVTGNLTWPQATTYTTGAAAAVATTAGSESGNTITITFAATPANCQIGNLITLAGITAGSGTATGYNSTAANGAGLGGFLILTRSATQITAFDATTGLGAISVQGTGGCPQEQDADVFAILGGSAAAPNHTLEPCEGRSGQPVYRMITNTNASPWTITGFNSETINGGASFTTPVAAGTNHPVVQLKSIPNAYASSGCTWQASLQ